MQMAYVSGLISCPNRWIETFFPRRAASVMSRDWATVSIPPVPQAPRSILDLVLDRVERQVRHELDDIARCPVLTGLLIVLLVESTNEFLEDCSHSVIVESRQLDDFLLCILVDRVGTEVDVRGGELVDDRPEDVCVHHCPDLVAELELVEDLLDVRRESVEIRLEVGLQCLLLPTAGEVLQQKRRRVAECLSRCVAEGGPLVVDLRSIQLFLHFQHGRFCLLEHHVEATDDCHRKDDVTIFSSYINIPKAIVSDSPDETDYRVVFLIVHCFFLHAHRSSAAAFLFYHYVLLAVLPALWPISCPSPRCFLPRRRNESSHRLR